MTLDPLVKKWRHRIEVGQAAKKKWKEDFRVDDLDRYWEGAQTPASWNGREFLSINLMFANVKSQLDGMLTNPPSFNVRPRRTYTVSEQFIQVMDLQANLRENTLNFLVSDDSLRSELKKAILDAYVYYGVVKVYYTPTLTPEERAGQPILSPKGAPTINAETGVTETYPDNKLIAEDFIVSRRNPSDILLDPYADSLENIEWVAERIQMTVKEAKDNKLFKNTDNLKSFDTRLEDRRDEDERKKPNQTATPMTGGNSSHAGLTGRPDSEEEIVYVWEIYDIKENKIITIIEGHDEVVRDDDTPEGIKKHPYAFLTFVTRRNSAYPIPELFNQLGPQDEYNITRNQIITHRKRYNRKYEVREGSVKDEELEKFEEGYDGLVVKTKVDGTVFHPIADPGLDQAVYFDVEMLRRDFMDIAGDSVPDSDIAKIEKASVASLLNSRMENRKGGKTTEIRDFIQTIGYKLMCLVEKELTLPMAISVNGPIGQSWIPVTKGRFIQGMDFTYEIAISSLLPRDPDSERTSWMAFLEFIGLNPQIGMSEVLLKKTAKMFGVEDQTIISELVKFAQAVQQQQMLTGGSAGKPSMAGDTRKQMGM